MNLLEASKLIRPEHVREAARLLAEHEEFNWLYSRTGREPPDYRYIVVEKRRYPSKAFGFLVAQIAGGTDRRSNDMNVNQAVAPLLRLGYKEVSGPARSDTPEERQARDESYYRALARPQQAVFRNSLLIAYEGKCAISGCSLTTVLEAAHVVPFRAKGENSLRNGILLRIDLHRLFDANELALDPSNLKPTFSVGAKEYLPHPQSAIVLPTGGPTRHDFGVRWKTFSLKTG